MALLLIKIAEVDKLLGRSSLSAGNRTRLTEKQRTFRANLEEEQRELSALRQKLLNAPPEEPVESEPETELANPLRADQEIPSLSEEGVTAVAAPSPDDDSLQAQLYRSHRHREALLEWLVDLREKVVTGVKESSRFQYLFEQSQAESLVLHQRVTELEHRVAMDQKERQRVEQQVTEEIRERQEIESSCEQLRAANFALEERGRRVSLERQQLRRAYEDLEGEMERTKQREAELERRLGSEEAQRSMLRPRLDELEREKAELLGSLTALTLEKNSWPERTDLEQKLLHLEQERARTNDGLAELEHRLGLAQSDGDALRARIVELESQNAELTRAAAAPGKSKKKAVPLDLEQRLQTSEKERAELERVAMMAERDRSGLAVRLGRLEQELVDHHAELDREIALRQQLKAEMAEIQAALKEREEERAVSAARAEQLEELLLLTEKELFQRQSQYNEERAKVESMADHFRTDRIEREKLEARIQLLARDKSESHRLIREQERQIKLLRHDLEFFNPDAPPFRSGKASGELRLDEV